MPKKKSKKKPQKKKKSFEYRTIYVDKINDSGMMETVRCLQRWNAKTETWEAIDA